jgi:hypothetical protein
MPTSNVFHLPPVIMLAGSLPNSRVLDLGIGMGTYGLMLRTALDIGDGHVAPNTWTRTIEGIEIFDAYRNPIWDYAYDRVHMGDIRDVLPRRGTYDIIVAGDVLEHFPRAEARTLMDEALRHAQVLIATTPRVEFPQGAWGGNEAETHHCLLEGADFPHLVLTLDAGVTSCFVCTADASLARSVREAALSCPGQLLDPVTRFTVRAQRKLRTLRESRSRKAAAVQKTSS